MGFHSITCIILLQPFIHVSKPWHAERILLAARDAPSAMILGNSTSSMIHMHTPKYSGMVMETILPFVRYPTVLKHTLYLVLHSDDTSMNVLIMYNSIQLS